MNVYHFGANEAARSQGYAHAVVSAFESAQAHDDYQVSPAHVEMKSYMGAFIQRMVVFDGAAPLLVPA
ncbi:Stress responsive A/B Barrel Domain protein [compost metagenome]